MVSRGMLALGMLVISVDGRAQDLSRLDQFVRSYIKASDIPAYRYAFLHLGTSTRLDAVVLLEGGYCGSGGCSLLVISDAEKKPKLISSSTLVQPPLAMLDEQQHGLRTLIVNTGKYGPVLLRFNGTRYPINPSLQTHASSAQQSVAQPITLRDRKSPG